MPRVLFALQNKIVDQCERLQLQSAGITKYVAEVLPGKSQRAVVGNSSPFPSILRLLLGKDPSFRGSNQSRVLSQPHTLIVLLTQSWMPRKDGLSF